jgi:hypothetical protein
MMQRQVLGFGVFVTALLLSIGAHATSISFLNGGLGGATNINNGNAFTITLVNQGATDVFINNTNKVIKDFKKGKQGTNIGKLDSGGLGYGNFLEAQSAGVRCWDDNLGERGGDGEYYKSF